MKELIFNSILIVDISKKTATYQEFKSGFNVITSSDNHVGKSSLIKSLYYAFGAEINYDPAWNKNSKIYIVNFSVDTQKYKIARFMKQFVLFKDDELFFATDNVSRELVHEFENIFDFGVYLSNKENKEIELAPPVFMFLPYYIDQDKGWSELYNSFDNLTQYKKEDRLKSLYYHLGIYNKNTIKLMTQKDSLNVQLGETEKEIERISIVLNSLSEEIKNIVPADDIEELERNLIIPKKQISLLVEELGKKRNKIQELEISLQNHKHQLFLVDKIKPFTSSTPSKITNIVSCPKCGHVLDNEIFEIVQKNYGAISKNYTKQQINLLIQRIEEEISQAKNEYIELTNKLKAEEVVYDEKKEAYNVYLEYRGLTNAFNSNSAAYEANMLKDAKIRESIKEIDSELKKIIDKKEIEDKYIKFVSENLLSLGAWEPEYDGNIKLLQPLKGQGTLMNKIILSQVIALFQTIDVFKIDSNKFPFVLDSPRGNEASTLSSEDILKLIFRIDCVPQIIISTVDFKDFELSINYSGEINIIELKTKYKLLEENVYQEYINEIESIYSLFQNYKKLEV